MRVAKTSFPNEATFTISGGLRGQLFNLLNLWRKSFLAFGRMREVDHPSICPLTSGLHCPSIFSLCDQIICWAIYSSGSLVFNALTDENSNVSDLQIYVFYFCLLAYANWLGLKIYGDLHATWPCMCFSLSLIMKNVYSLSKWQCSCKWSPIIRHVLCLPTLTLFPSCVSFDVSLVILGEFLAVGSHQELRFFII